MMLRTHYHISNDAIGRARTAFTLIELLVVVAIIALLISILVPAMSSARERGRATKCLGNMHVLGMGVLMYADENRGWFPEWGLNHGGGKGRESRSWISRMQREYGESRELLRCPSDRSRFWNQDYKAGVRRSTSYATNYYLASADTELTYEAGRPFNRLDWIKHTSTTVYFVELVIEGEFAVADHVHPEAWFEFAPKERDKAATQMAVDMHDRKANYAMVDGHVSRLAFEQSYDVDEANSTEERPAFLQNKFNPLIAR